MHKKSAIVRLPFTTLMDKDKKDVLNESSDYFNLNLQY